MRGVDVVIDPRFNGPPDSGHGGYCAGRAAALVEPAPGGAVEVTLRRPVPLATPLAVAEHGDGAVELTAGGELVMAARPVPAPDGAPPVVDVAGARAAADPVGWADGHPFPTCFGCGPRARSRRRAAPVRRERRRRPLRGALDRRRRGRARGRRGARVRLGGAGLPELRPGAGPRPGRPRPVHGRLLRRAAADRRGVRRRVVAGGGRRPQAPHRGVLHDGAGTVLARGRATWIALRG